MQPHLNTANTRILGDGSRNISHTNMLNQVTLVLSKLRERSRALKSGQSSGPRQTVPLADVSQRLGAARSVVDSNDIVDLGALGAGSRGHGRGDLVKVVALEKSPDVGVNIKSVTANVLEVVVDGVEENLALGGISSNMRSTARNIVNPVAREGVVILLTNKQHGPVVLSVAARRPRRLSVKLVVGDGDVSRGSPARDEHLSTDEGELVVVDPDLVGAVEGDGIATPDVLRVQVGDVDVLDDDVLCSAADAEALAHDDALVSDTDDTLVASKVNWLSGCIVVGAVGPGAG